MNNFILTTENYYSSEANQAFMSVSQYKSFCRCEAAAMAELRGEWDFPMTTALLVGSYVDAHFEGTLDLFRAQHPELFKKDGGLKADYVNAEEIISRIEKDALFMEYMAGKKQRLFTGELAGVRWKIKIDAYHPGKMIVDLKCMRSMERIMGRSFVEHWEYDTQMAVYSAIESASTGSAGLETYLAVATKENPANLEIIHIPEYRRAEKIADIERNLPHIIEVKSGHIEPRRCGVCDYCRATKVLKEPLDFELVGFNEYEKKAIFEGIY